MDGNIGTAMTPMTTEHAPAASWTEPDGITPRGTLIVIPGRGEQPELYERFGRRIAGDGYRVHAVADPAAGAALTTAQVLAHAPAVRPYVLVGSDTGALFAAGLVASGQVTGVDALVLAGLPVVTDATDATDVIGTEPSEAGSAALASWEDELDTRTACPAHRGRLAGRGLRRGALYEPVPDGWIARADLGFVTQPVLCVHGADDPISPLPLARARYAAAPRAGLVTIAGGRHDTLNDITHRTVAATIVMFLERLRLGSDLPTIAVSESLGR
jgi:alpha-beta hydrolase superfamily lysophospholipase